MSIRTRETHRPVLAVVGASGGVGASTWAAAVAARLAVHDGECVLVDGDLRSGGLEMTCAIEHVPGLRWPDLARLKGVTEGARLCEALPRGEAAVLSADGSGSDLDLEVVHDVLDSLALAVAVVVDLPKWSALTEQVVAVAEAVHVVSGLEPRQIADCEAVLRGLAPTVATAERLGVVTRSDRGCSIEVEEVVQRLGCAHLAHVRDDARVRRDAARGDWPGRRGGVRDCADSAVLDFIEDREGARRSLGAA